MARRVGRAIDVVGRHIATHLARATGWRWRASFATPRRFWARRFTFTPPRRRSAYYDDVEAAWLSLQRDGLVDKWMAGMAMAVQHTVEDGETGDERFLTTAAAASWERALEEADRKIYEWTQRYGHNTGAQSSSSFDEEAAESSSRILRIEVFVGDVDRRIRIKKKLKSTRKNVKRRS